MISGLQQSTKKFVGIQEGRVVVVNDVYFWKSDFNRA